MSVFGNYTFKPSSGLQNVGENTLLKYNTQDLRKATITMNQNMPQEQNAKLNNSFRNKLPTRRLSQAENMPLRKHSLPANRPSEKYVRFNRRMTVDISQK